MKRAGQIVSLLLTIALLFFAWHYINTLVSEIDFSILTVNWLLAGLSVLCFIVFYGLLAWHWLLVCRMVKSDTRDEQAFAFVASQVYKYLPTSLFTFSFRAVYAKKLGLSLKHSSAAQFIENVSMLTANFGLFAVLYAASVNLWLGALVLLTVGLVVALGNIRDSYTIKAGRRQLIIDTRALTAALLVALLGWLVAGLAFVVLNLSLDLPINLLGFMAANTIAFSLSILAFFAPGGIGVRELVFGAFGVSALAVIAWRILTFSADIVLGIGAITSIEIKRRKRVRS